MTSVNIGIIGLGNWGNKLAASLKNIAEANLVSCYARTKNKREDFANKYSCEAKDTIADFLNDKRLDGVLIATPHSSHVEMITTVAKSKKHIMVEKPLTLTTKDAKDCVDCANKHGIYLQVAHYRRLLPATRLLKKYIESDKLGHIHHFESNFSRPFGPDPNRPWRDSEEEAPAGAFTALGVHMIDNLLYLGGDFQKICALSSVLDDGTPLDDITTVMIKFTSGAHGIINTSLRLPFIASVSAHGDKASAWSNSDGSQFLTQGIDDITQKEIEVVPLDGVVENLRNFCLSIINSNIPETSGLEGMKVVRALEAITESVNSDNRFIDI
tara:strand:- start:85641 stop:86621 length:981 start_codon:yes stop_codon:yes gene_type:complete